MPFSGTGTVTSLPSPTIGLSVIPELTTLNLCLSFDDSLARLHINNRCGAYGAPVENCGVAYKVYQREGWLQALIDAQTIVERDIGRPICPTEICDEVHPYVDNISLNHAPIAYLGTKEWGEWTEAELVLNEDGSYGIDICDSELDFETEYIQFGYAAEILSCYRGLQSLQIPCAERIEDGCGLAEGGYRFSWDRCQLIRPDVDTADPNSTKPAEIAKFITAVRWRTYTLGAATAEWVGECNCSCCTSNPVPQLSILDARDGVVCVDNSCGCRNGRRIKISYATSMDCYGRNDDLLRAVVLLALAAVGHSASKPCGCDTRFVDRMLEIDPTSQTEFASRIRYGPTFAEMAAMRIVNGYINRPKLHSGVQTGGMLAARRSHGSSLR